MPVTVDNHNQVALQLEPYLIKKLTKDNYLHAYICKVVFKTIQSWNLHTKPNVIAIQNNFRNQLVHYLAKLDDAVSNRYLPYWQAINEGLTEDTMTWFNELLTQYILTPKQTKFRQKVIDELTYDNLSEPQWDNFAYNDLKYQCSKFEEPCAVYQAAMAKLFTKPIRE